MAGQGYRLMLKPDGVFGEVRKSPGFLLGLSLQAPCAIAVEGKPKLLQVQSHCWGGGGAQTPLVVFLKLRREAPDEVYTFL